MTLPALPVPTSQRPTRGLLRELLVAAGATSIALALPFALSTGHNMNGWGLAIAMSALALASYPMSRARNLLAQLFARAIWWQALAFGVVLAIAEGAGALHGPLSSAMPMYVLGGLLAITSAGKVGLDFDSDHFVPVAFRRSLTASLVMAMADTLALLFYGAIVLVDGSMRVDTFVDAAQFGGAALVMGVAIVGLYRLEVWGLALNIGANLLIATLALCGAFEIPMPIALGLAATALGQLLLPIPLLRRMAKKAS